MQKTISLIVVCALIVLSANTVNAACTSWDITGTWQYQQSDGPICTLIFSQDASGILTGT